MLVGMEIDKMQISEWPFGSKIVVSADAELSKFSFISMAWGQANIEIWWNVLSHLKLRILKTYA